MAACGAYMAAKGVAEKDLYLWLDYSSVDQDDDSLLVKGVIVMKSEDEWDRFMRFMERYAEANGLGFTKA